MLNYYGTKSFNNNILSLAIVHFNKNAFVRNNPNYLYSGKKLYLPSINEIRNLIIKKNKKKINININTENLLGSTGINVAFQDGHVDIVNKSLLFFFDVS